MNATFSIFDLIAAGCVGLLAGVVLALCFLSIELACRPNGSGYQPERDEREPLPPPTHP